MARTATKHRPLAKTRIYDELRQIIELDEKWKTGLYSHSRTLREGPLLSPMRNCTAAPTGLMAIGEAIFAMHVKMHPTTEIVTNEYPDQPRISGACRWRWRRSYKTPTVVWSDFTAPESSRKCRFWFQQSEGGKKIEIPSNLICCVMRCLEKALYDSSFSETEAAPCRFWTSTLGCRPTELVNPALMIANETDTLMSLLLWLK